MPPPSSSGRLTFSAAGFIATSTFGCAAGREDVPRREVDLEGRDAGQGAGGGADLGREVGERDEVVADQRGGRGEAVAGELHAVARIAGEADDDPLLFLDCLCHLSGFRDILPLTSALRSRMVPALEDRLEIP